MDGRNEQFLPPVFIVSPTGKSGTNFLAKVLVTLDLCERPKVEVLTREDYLLFNSERLRQYAFETANIWKRWEKDDKQLNLRTKQLLKNIGDGVLQFLGTPSDPRKRLVVKTPDSNQLKNFPDLFPEAKLILLVRDGRDTSESQVKAGYRPEYEGAFQNWAARTRDLLDFMQNRGKALEAKMWIMIHYEQLVNDPQSTADELATFLGCDDTVMDGARINDLPVLGSAYVGTNEDGPQVSTWRVANKPKDFNPVGRWVDWDVERRKQFKEIAGKELVELGYESDQSW